jgi:hypothetical protein
MTCEAWRIKSVVQSREKVSAVENRIERFTVVAFVQVIIRVKCKRNRVKTRWKALFLSG